MTAVTAGSTLEADWICGAVLSGVHSRESGRSDRHERLKKREGLVDRSRSSSWIRFRRPVIPSHRRRSARDVGVDDALKERMRVGNEIRRPGCNR